VRGVNKDSCLLIFISSIGLQYCFVEDKMKRGINIFHWWSCIAWAHFRYYLSRINLICWNWILFLIISNLNMKKKITLNYISLKISIYS